MPRWFWRTPIALILTFLFFVIQFLILADLYIRRWQDHERAIHEFMARKPTPSISRTP